MLLLPWWIYVCIIGILISGYMAFRTAREDKMVDQEFIEKEGQVFLERIEKERQMRQEAAQQLEALENDKSVS
ncbi:sporulation YhaL family protein [Metabacillus malikii]|uniref:SigE-dependent sporulation protein n=1 Tax=Metabacillus malikii TaxID=1504265 RepID=A0ABT9ZJ60_9BACI|nr:sporulation YhaL family protein [Metabacillus malikii]MDQ0232316.1 hypothetical protein [Metabacillus malikii]